jgi:Cu+-exporting ATPase
MTADQTFSVTGMTCQGCAKTVQKAALGISGVQHAVAAPDKNSLLITAAREVSVDEVAAVLAGYSKYRVEGAREKGFWSDKLVWSRSGFNN